MIQCKYISNNLHTSNKLSLEVFVDINIIINIIHSICLQNITFKDQSGLRYVAIKKSNNKVYIKGKNVLDKDPFNLY